MTYTRSYPNDFTQNGTKVKKGFENDDAELKRIYGLFDSVGAISLAGTKRQSVLYASTNNGEPNYLTASGLNVSLDGSAINVLLAFAYGFDDKGAVDFLEKIETLVSNAWTLPSNSTAYLYIDRDISTNTISYGYSALEDVYQKTAPTATLDQHWYDTNECKMFRYNGSAWEAKQRVFVAKAVTDASATTLTIYPLQTRAPQAINILGNATTAGACTGNAATADKVNHSFTINGTPFDGSEAKSVDITAGHVWDATPATTSSTASSTNPAVVVENYVNGTNWYRVWSDGWIEQGGRFSSVDKSDTTVTYLKAFANTDYSIIVGQMYGLSGDNSFWNWAIGTIASTYAVVRNGTNGTNVCLWYACGY